MNITFCILPISLDRLGGLNSRHAALIRGLATRGHEVTVIQTKSAFQESSGFFKTVSSLPVKALPTDFELKRGYLRWPSLISLWCLPFKSTIPKNTNVLLLDDPKIIFPKDRSYKVVFFHNHFSPYIFESIRNVGFRALPSLIEIHFLNALLRKATIDGCITETESQRRWVIEKYYLSPEIVEAVPPGYDADLVHSLNLITTRNNNLCSITFTGRIKMWKGVYELLEAFSLLLHHYPNCCLNYIGDGPAMPALKKKAIKRGLEKQVVFWGRQSYEQTLKLVSKADIFVLPSYIESFPLSLIEAMALGIPSIATKVGGIEEHLIKDGETGMLIKPKALDALYYALERLVSNPLLRTSLGKNGKSLAENLTLERMVSTTENFLLRIL